MVDFSNREQMSAWMQGLTTEGFAALAVRATLRALSRLTSSYDQRQTLDRVALPSLHRIIVSGIASTGVTDDLSRAAVVSGKVDPLLAQSFIVTPDEDGRIRVPVPLFPLTTYGTLGAWFHSDHDRRAREAGSCLVLCAGGTETHKAAWRYARKLVTLDQAAA